MIDTNIEQRQSLTYSEKAYAYRMRLELIGQQGKRNDLSGSEKTDSLAEVGKEHKESRRTVAYLIRLTHLLPELLKLVDPTARKRQWDRENSFVTVDNVCTYK